MNWEEFFDDGVWKNQMNPMEKKKLVRLTEERDALWRVANKLESERNKLRKNLVPNNLEALEAAKIDRDAVLKAISDEIKELKERRKKVHKEFKEKTAYIRQERRTQLKTNPELRENKRQKDITWERIRKKSKEENQYYRKLKEKYSLNHGKVKA